jgi:flagellar hook-length control protein FliK
MAINTGTLALGSSMPAKAPFSARASGSPAAGVSEDPHPDANQHSQAGSATGSGAGQASSTSDSSDGAASGRKPTGPSAQTRNAQTSQSRASSRAPRSRTNAADATPGQAGADPAAGAQASASDFGSVMASALGRGATATTAEPVPVSTGTDNTDSATTATPGQPAPGTLVDAIAWFAQALMPAATGAPAVATAPDTANAAVSGSDAIGSATAANTVASIGLPAGPGVAVGNTPTPATLAAQLATQNAVNAGPSPADAAAPQIAALPAAQTQTGQANDAAMSAASAAAPGTINALADVQKLITGLTAANSTDPDTDTDSAAPKTHAATDSGATDDTQAAAALQASSLTRPDTSLGAATLTIHAPVGSAAFADEVSARVTGLAQSGITQAQLQLNPADMGPVQVHITMQAGQASVWFGATHADTRAALEQSLPRLRELFAGAGMPLTDSGVFREPPQQQQAQSQPVSGNSRGTLADTVVAPTVTQVANIRLSLLDTYA